MLLRLFFAGLTTAILLAGSGFAQAQDPTAEINRAVSSAVAADKRAAREASDWAGQRSALLSEISLLKAQQNRLEHQVGKYRAYLRTQEEAYARLEHKQEALAKLNLELEPYLETAYARLEEFIDRDLPFLPQERSRRLSFLRRSLDDYHLELSEKLRRLMEALAVEAEYGNKVEKTRITLDLEGRPTRVDLFRLGRLSLYYLTPDGSRMGWLPRGGEGWQSLDPVHGRTLVRAMEMAERQRAVELLTLPVGRPEK